MKLCYCMTRPGPQSAMFGVAGLRLTARLRRLTMAAILRQEMAFFDDPMNSVGALCSRLATDSSNIHGVSGGAAREVWPEPRYRV